MARFLFAAAVVGLSAGMWSFGGCPAAADDFDDSQVRGEGGGEDPWYYRDEPAHYRPNPQAIIHQKAQLRAQHRQARIEAMNWYGMSNSRPTASATPFCSVYSPTWQMPGGRPFAWYASYRPIYVIDAR